MTIKKISEIINGICDELGSRVIFKGECSVIGEEFEIIVEQINHIQRVVLLCHEVDWGVIDLISSVFYNIISEYFSMDERKFYKYKIVWVKY